MKVFLGGTCNDSLWRDTLIPQLQIDFFNPIVATWTEADYQRELHERATCDFCLYVITPRAKGFYSIAEVADDSNKRPEKTIYCVLEQDGDQTFEPHQYKSLQKVGEMVRNNGGKVCANLQEVAQFLNHQSTQAV